MRPDVRKVRRGGGFTILELAITLAIMAVLAVGILVPFVAQVSQRKVADTERILEQAKEALLGYATDYANGVQDEPTPVQTLVDMMAASTETFARVLAASVPLAEAADLSPAGMVFRFD